MPERDIEDRVRDLEAAVETVVRHLDACARMMTSALGAVPVLDTMRAPTEELADPRPVANHPR